MEKRTYCNPLPFTDGKRHTNPDPYILRWCGNYYCYSTDHLGVKVSISKDLSLWEGRGYALREETHREYWAPAVMYHNGTFYLYYSSVPLGEGDCHQEFLKVATSEHPMGPFTWVHTFFDKFSIDAHPVWWNGRNYLFYSVNDWIGTDDKIAGTGIVVDELITPTQLRGQPKAVVMPSLEQEIYERNRFGDGRDWYTIEGAAPIIRNDRCWVLYSGNAFVNVDYFVGSAVAKCTEDFLDMQWNKYPSKDIWHALLRKNDWVEGTGHNTVVKAPNLVDEWIVYHGRNATEPLIPEVEQREMRMDPLYFSGDQVVCLGPSATPQPVPGMPMCALNNQTLLSSWHTPVDSPYYVAEYWCSVTMSHVGAQYGIYLAYEDEKNYLELRIHSGKRCCSIQKVEGGIQQVLLECPLPSGYQCAVPHCIRVEKNFVAYRISFDEAYHIDLESAFLEYCPSIGVAPHFTSITLHSFALTLSASLSGNSLMRLPYFYGVNPLHLSETGLSAVDGAIQLDTKGTTADGVCEIQFHSGDRNATIRLVLEDGTAVTAIPAVQEFSVIYEDEGTTLLLMGGTNECIAQKIDRIIVDNAQIIGFTHTKK